MTSRNIFLKKIFAFSLIYFLLFFEMRRADNCYFLICSFHVFTILSLFKRKAVGCSVVDPIFFEKIFSNLFSYILCLCFHLKRKILSLFNRKASGCSSADPIFFEKPEHPPPLLPCVKGLKTSAGCFYNFASNISYFK